MDDHTITSIVTVLIAIIGVAIVAVIVGGSNTSGILSAGGSSIAGALKCALSPVIGGNSCGGSLLTNVTSTISY